MEVHSTFNLIKIVLLKSETKKFIEKSLKLAGPLILVSAYPRPTWIQGTLVMTPSCCIFEALKGKTRECPFLHNRENKRTKLKDFLFLY